MNIFGIIFIISAIVNIVVATKKWIDTDEEQVSAIAGWTCAIMFCIGMYLK